MEMIDKQCWDHICLGPKRAKEEVIAVERTPAEEFYHKQLCNILHVPQSL